MMCAGVVAWLLEANVRITRATEEVSQRLEDAEETANRLCEGMSDLYELMAGPKPLPTPAVNSAVASFPRRSSSSGAERLPCLKGRSDPAALRL